MASSVHGLPVYLLAPGSKSAVIAWIKERHLPSRFGRRLLQDWAEYIGVILTPEDYAQVGWVGHT